MTLDDNLFKVGDFVKLTDRVFINSQYYACARAQTYIISKFEPVFFHSERGTDIVGFHYVLVDMLTLTAPTYLPPYLLSDEIALAHE